MNQGLPYGSLKHSSVRRQAFSLIEIIAVVAIIAIFAAVTLRALIREKDAQFVRDERAALKAYSEALQRGIMRQARIPDHTGSDTGGWARMVADEMSVSKGAVAQNSRRQPRVLLIDPGDIFTPGIVDLPYTQNEMGIFRVDPAINPPNRARFILASSVGPNPLPVSAGLMTTNDFEVLWNSAPGIVPAGTTWAGFRPEDLILERIDLSQRLVMVTLTTDSEVLVQKGRYAINNGSVRYVDDQPRFFIENSVVQLLHSNEAGDALDSQHVLIRGASFHYANRKWVSGDNGGPKYGGLDLAAVARQFLICVPNLNAPANQQAIIVEAMNTFMKDYVMWKEVGQFKRGVYYDRALASQQAMMIQAQRIFLKEGNTVRYPMNNVAPCVP